MIDFFLGTLAGAFIMMVFLQLTTKKTITLAGYDEKSEDPKRYWVFTLTYFTGFLGMVVVLLF